MNQDHSVVPAMPPQMAALPPVDIGFTPANTVFVDPKSGTVRIEEADGSVTFNFGGKDAEGHETEFDDNLAANGRIDESTLNLMAEEILRGIEEDERSRKDWEDTFNRGLDLLGLKLDDPSSDVSTSGNISKVYHPLLIEAVVRYQANASAELLPAAGPVKVMDARPTTDTERTELAEALEKDFNYYLTVVRKEYYPDTRRLLFGQGFCGNGFKKVYRCPIRKAPVSDYVAAKDLIVSNDATSLSNAVRVTHRTSMRRSVLKRMQLSGYYRKVELTQPVSSPTEIDKKIGRIEGVDKQNTVPSDHSYTIYECYTEYDIPGFEHEDEDGEETGLPLPYRVSIDKDSRKILEIRRNWREDDEDFMQRQRFVKYGYIPGMGFYDYGLVHLLGQTARALTAIERQLIDAGQFANFPGVLLSDAGGRQETTQLRVSPGGSAVIKTNGMPITSVVMPLPYKEPSTALMNVGKGIEDNGRRLGGTAEVQVGEGRADVPVGTTIALIEQSTKLEGAIHKQNHESQQQEFILLKELFEEDPSSLSKFNKNPARAWQTAQEIEDRELVPASDPNIPSHIHRIMRATALAQLVQQDPSGYNVRAVRAELLTTIGYSPSAYLAPEGNGPAAPQIDPAKMAKVQVDQAKVDEKKQSTAINAQIKVEQMKSEAEDRERERQSRERIQEMKTVGGIATQQQQQKTDMIKNAHGFASEAFHKRQDNMHDMVKDHLQRAHDRSENEADRANQKDIAESKSNMVSSDES